MGLKTSSYVCLALLFLGLAMLMYYPSHVPEWAEERTRLRAISYAFALSGHLSWLWCSLTGADDVETRRFFLELAYNPYFSDLTSGMKYTETQFDGVPVQIFHPDTAGDNAPAIIYIHGGGWTFFNADTYKTTTHHMASTYNVAVISIDYRLAPEHPYPVPFDDCVKATVYLLRNAHKLGIDPNRVAIAGDSAGGNLAAAVTLRLSQDDLASQLPRLKFQVLIYPAMQMVDMNTYSYQAFDKTAWLDQATMVFMWLSYMGYPELQAESAQFASNNHTAPLLKKSLNASFLKHDNLPKEMREEGFQAVGSKTGNEELAAKIETRALDPFFCPLLAPDLSKVPPAYLIIAQNDVLRDDGLMYAERLKKAGVNTEVDFHKTMPHGFCALFPYSAISYQGGLKAFQTLAPYVKENI